MNDAHNCTKSGGKSRSASSRRRQGRDSRPRQQKSIKARETYIVNGLAPDFSHGSQELCNIQKYTLNQGVAAGFYHNKPNTDMADYPISHSPDVG